MGRGHGPRCRHRARRAGPLRGGRRGLRHRRSRHRAGHLSDGGDHHRGRVPARCRGAGGGALHRCHSSQDREGPTPVSMANFYVNPEQLVREKAEFARRNIARGRPLIASTFSDGIVLASENTNPTLHKISEIYDRIAFAGVGLYSEFDRMRQAGVQHADVKGYQFSREDVEGRALANLYAQYMHQSFTHEVKPYEIEILVAEVGLTEADDLLYRIPFDGSLVEERRFAILGGESDAIAERMEEGYRDGANLADALKAASAALSGPDRTIPGEDLEVAVLDRVHVGRAFRRL